ncbi:PQQ-dependent sugar dehydrogenase [Luteimonas sp. MC1750]|uniref:PQQ-dependent sugar dehydrogenase n=1 Tax=Luteimonas sp. MC1750 TaxID=2799326 RepID=UPI0018F0EA70|nr:PQQ-dependent sugar dehydrogenase [Luteimonas sp. MC1750]MBJ6984940.1 PQQ-dependent sugar dehydrogenase [Luteimonas sp. MC1750]QQO05614.1 PQQ-dependent sugar dehydrogenase [Luteimonas sp. MC1750]
MKPHLLASALALAFATTACNGSAGSAAGAASNAGADGATAPAAAGQPFEVDVIAVFDEPWAMSFLPDGRLLVTEKKGRLKLVDVESGASQDVAGVPDVDYGGQGGFGDVVPHPGFADNGIVYLSYAEAGRGDRRGAALARARLVTGEDGGARLDGLEVIWRQVPKVDGRGHYGHRIAFDGEGKLWLSSSERQKFDPAQDMASNMGKVLRLDDDGRPAAGNPFAAQGGVAAEVWSLGHRNVLGLAFDGGGRLWDVEMGPAGGDELNLVERGANYGYPIVSNGDHYDGTPIPDHDTRPEFSAPAVGWTPVISPSSLVFYSGDVFPQWTGSALIGGLSSQALVRVEFDGTTAREAERFDMGQRIREVEQGPEGGLWLLEDGEGGRLLKLLPAG